MKLKPKTYYKTYSNSTCSTYSILYTDDERCYYIAYKYKNTPILKYDENLKRGTIKQLQEFINHNNYKIEEISEADVFLELL